MVEKHDTVIIGAGPSGCKCAQTLAENKTTRETMGKNAHEFVVNNFSGEIITNEWINFYNQLSN